MLTFAIIFLILLAFVLLVVEKTKIGYSFADKLAKKAFGINLDDSEEEE